MKIKKSMELSGLLDKVNFLLNAAKNNLHDVETIEVIKELTKEQSNHPRLGRFFGYSVSDYAYATLKWLNTRESISVFNSMYNELDDDSKQKISELISQKVYLEI